MVRITRISGKKMPVWAFIIMPTGIKTRGGMRDDIKISTFYEKGGIRGTRCGMP
jgi:hypothetical protein